MVVANAGNAQVVSDALAERLAGARAVLDDQSLATGLVAVQGPRSVDVLRPLTDVDLDGAALLRDRRGVGRRDPGAGRADRLHRRGRLRGLRRDRRGSASCGTRCSTAVRRPTGCRSASAPATRCGSRPACRSTATSSIVDDDAVRRRARPGRQARQDRPTSSGGPPSRRSPPTAPTKRLVGLIVEGRGIARHGYPVHAGERRTGVVTSGTQSPTLGVPIAMAYVAPADGEPGTILDVEIRDARVPARVVPLPFYRRST